jgi:hypothetical protein
MGARQRIDNTGKTGGPFSGRDRRLYSPPHGVEWIFLDIVLLKSPPFQALSINARKIFDFLLIEHRLHAQQENGRLIAPYDQLERFGISRRLINAAFAELHAAGLVRLTRQGGMMSGERVPAQYRLTMFTDVTKTPPTNDWKAATADAVETARRDHASNILKRVANRNARRVQAAGA